MLGLGFDGGDDIFRSPQTHMILISMTGQAPNNTAGITNNLTSRRTDFASPQGDITNMRCVDCAGPFQISGGPVGASVQFTIKRYCEYPEGVFHRVYWEGAGTRMMGGAAGIAHISDVILSSVTGAPLSIPAGAKFWWRTVNVSGATIAAFPVVQRPAWSVSLGIEDGNSVSDLGNSGTIAASSSPNSFGPAAVLGTVASARARSFLILGDSLADGQGDVSGVGPNNSSGWIARGLADRYPVCKLTRPGQFAANLATGSSALSSLLTVLSGSYTDIVNEAGLNDLSQAGSSAAQIISWRQAIDARLDAGARRWWTTVTARSNSTDGYMTTVNQTPKTDGNMAELGSLNAAIRGDGAGAYALIDAADFTMGTRDSFIHSGPFPPVLDGTHFTSAKADDMASRLRSIMTV